MTNTAETHENGELALSEHAKDIRARREALQDRRHDIEAELEHVRVDMIRVSNACQHENQRTHRDYAGGYDVTCLDCGKLLAG